MLKLPFAILSAALSMAAQSAGPAKQPAVRVPTFANPTCPIMGKKVSMPLFVDTEVGRFYVCCKPCFKKILADLPAAQKTAYPTVKTINNKLCPVSGEAIGEHKQTMTLQGFQFDVCCAGCTDGARSRSQVVLSKLDAANLKDIGNTTCPLTGKPVTDNSFVVIGDSIVHLASTANVADAEKAPQATLDKAIEIAARQPAQPKHVHRTGAGNESEKQGEPKETGK
jgi:hypothetical protein